MACVLYHRSLLNLRSVLKKSYIERCIHSAACVFLASKADDNPIDLNDIKNLLKASEIFPENFSKFFSPPREKIRLVSYA